MNKADKETLSAIIQTQIGVSKKLKGYQYLEDAVEIALQNPQMPVMQIISCSATSTAEVQSALNERSAMRLKLLMIRHN